MTDGSDRASDLKGWEASPRAYRCHLAIMREDQGFSVVVLNLPGVGGQGDTVEQAIENTREAVLAAMESYGDNVPWRTGGYDVPAGVESRWVMVAAESSLKRELKAWDAASDEVWDHPQ